MYITSTRRQPVTCENKSGNDCKPGVRCVALNCMEECLVLQFKPYCYIVKVSILKLYPDVVDVVSITNLDTKLINNDFIATVASR